MKSIVSLLLLSILSLGGSLAQDHYDPDKALSSEELFLKQQQNSRAFTKPGVRYLVLDASPMVGGFHRFRYFPGDLIRFNANGLPGRQQQEIYTLTDSSFTFAYIDEAARQMLSKEVLLKDLRRVKTYRRIPWVTEGAVLLPLAGLVFIGADFFNEGIDGQRFTTDAQAFAVGGALAATGFICYKLSFASVKINGRNRLKILKTY